MPTLMDCLPLPEKRPEVIDDCNALLEVEVKGKRGVSGLAVKAGFKVLKTFKPGAVRETIDSLLDEFIRVLEPRHEAFLKEKHGTFGDLLKRDPSGVANSLLEVTDTRADRSPHKTLKGAYRKLRPSAERHVAQAVPGLADLLDRHYETPASD